MIEVDSGLLLAGCSWWVAETVWGKGSRLAIKWGVGVSQAARQLREYAYMTKHVEPSRPVIDSMQLKSLCLSKSFSRGIVSSVLSTLRPNTT